jgi:hypothetical protein
MHGFAAGEAHMATSGRKPADFGGGASRPRGNGSPWPVVALAIGMTIAVVVGTFVQQQPHNIAEARRWTITGPPCPTADARAFAGSVVVSGLQFAYDDVTFVRGNGHVYCDEIHDDGGRGFGSHPVCQFTGPVALKVTTSRGDVYFGPLTGRATVAVANHVPSCVRGGWFTGSPAQF